METLETERLVLRQWEPEDAGFVLDLYSRWEVQRFIGNPPQVMKDLVQAQERIQGWRAMDHPVHGIWAVELKGHGVLAGTMLLKDIPASGPPPLHPSGDTEIGWHFHPGAWGHGYATEAARTVLDYAFAGGLPKVVAVTAPANIASQKVCSRIGMIHQGQTGRYYNMLCELFELTRAAA